jgi:hypothetical protein
LDHHLSDFAYIALLRPPIVAAEGMQKAVTIDRLTLNIPVQEVYYKAQSRIVQYVYKENKATPGHKTSQE